MIKPKLSPDALRECLTKVINGSSYKDLSKEVDLSVSQLSVKVRALAKELNLEAKLNESLANQKAARNQSGQIANLGKLYVTTREPFAQVWKPVPSYEGVEVSNNGLIRTKTKILTPSIKTKTFTFYAQVTLFKEGKRHYESIHRLVLSAFNPIENYEHYQVDHINGDGLDNSLSNLRWVTGYENIFYSFDLNASQKIAICSKGGSKAGANSAKRAEERFKALLNSRFISYNKSHNSTVTYICKSCGQETTDAITSKSFRYGADGICSSCRRKD